MDLDLMYGEITEDHRRQVEESRRNVPRFLFRYFDQRSGGADTSVWRASNPLHNLNDEHGVRPHLYARTGQLSPSIWAIPMLRHMVGNHLACEASFASEFTSWAASLEWVIWYYFEGIADSDSGYLAVFDTSKATDVPVYHAKALYNANIAEADFSHEYLAHGAVHGEAYVAVPIRNLIAASGIREQTEQMYGLNRYKPIRLIDVVCRPLTSRVVFSEIERPRSYDQYGVHPGEIEIAKQLACCFRNTWQRKHPGGARPDDLAVYIFAALLTLGYTDDVVLTGADVEEMVVELHSQPTVTLRQELAQEWWMAAGCVYTRGFSDLSSCLALIARLLNGQ